MADYGPDVRKILKKAGCHFVRQGRGDHEIWENPRTPLRFPVGAKIKSRHTANGVLKQADLENAF